MTPPSERQLHAQIAAHESWAATPDRSARTAPGRAALEAKFLADADGDPIRAEHIRKAYFARMTLKSIQARRKIREATAVIETVDEELQSLGIDGSGSAA